MAMALPQIAHFSIRCIPSDKTGNTTLPSPAESSKARRLQAVCGLGVTEDLRIAKMSATVAASGVTAIAAIA